MIPILKGACGLAAFAALAPVAYLVAGLIWLWEGVNGTRSRERLAAYAVQQAAAIAASQDEFWASVEALFAKQQPQIPAQRRATP